MWRKNLSILSVVAILLLSACGNHLKKPLVKPISSKVELPSKHEIKSITLAGAGIGKMVMVPKNPSFTKVKIESWFKDSSPVSVTFPSSKINDNGKGDRYEPAMLILHLNNGKLMLNILLI